MSLPTIVGSRWLYRSGSTLIADACRPALCEKADEPDVRLMGVRRDVGQLGQRVRDAHHLDQGPVGQHRQVHLGRQVAHHREQVGVAGALAVSVGRALHMGGAGLHRGDRVGHRATGVVLAVNAYPEPAPFPDLADDPLDLHRQHAAVGVAEHHHVGAGGHRGLGHPQPVITVGGEPVEEVLAVQKHPPAVIHQQPDRVGDHGQVLRQRGAQGALHVPDVGLGDQGDHLGPGVQQSTDLRILLRPGAGLAGGTEGDQLGRGQRELTGRGPSEEFGVLGHRPRPPALDEADAQLVQQGRRPRSCRPPSR